eukprot:4652688-Pleurochrysis_carterae.AAC.3
MGSSSEVYGTAMRDTLWHMLVWSHSRPRACWKGIENSSEGCGNSLEVFWESRCQSHALYCWIRRLWNRCVLSRAS